MKNKYFIIIILLALISAFFIYSSNHRDKIIERSRNNICNKFTIIEANTPGSREKGLSGMDRLADNSIMLFTFDKPNKYGFWMKDMKFPIDIIWLDKDYKIVHIEEKVSPNSYPKIFYPERESLYVVEMNAGLAQKNAIKLDDIFNPRENCK